MKIWLDDERPAPEGWERTYDAQTTLVLLGARTDVDEISVDHDLGHADSNSVNNGYYVLCTLEEWMAYADDSVQDFDLEGNEVINKMRDYVPEKISVHSANSGARKKMEQAIESIERMRSGK